MRTVLCLCLALPALALDVRVLDMDEQVTSGTALAVEGQDLVVTLSEGGQKRIACDAVVEITFPSAAPVAAEKEPQVDVVLTNGDVIRGEVTGGNSEHVVLAAGEMGKVDLPSANVSHVLVNAERNRDKVPPDAAPAEYDRLYLANGDTDVGCPLSEGDALKPEGITVHSERTGKDVTYPWAQVAGWYLMGAQPVEAPKTLLATVVCSGGTRLTGTLASITGGTLTLDHVLVKQVPVPIPAIRAIYFVNGRVAWLSDQSPSAVHEHPFVYSPESPEPTSFPWKRDSAVGRGGPLRIKDREFRKGIGAHGYSALEFSLGGQYQRLCATVGLQKETSPAGDSLGSVVFQVLEGTIDQVDPELRVYLRTVTDWKGLCARLVSKDAAARRFAEAIGREGMKPIEELASGEEATDARKAEARNAVNAALAKADLYQAEAFPADRLPEDARAILAKDASERTRREVDRLHRRCLELAVGDAVPAAPAPPKVLYDSGLVRYGEDPKDLSVEVSGKDRVVLVVRCGLEGDILDGDTYDCGVWGGARLIK